MSLLSRFSRREPMPVPEAHAVNGQPLVGPFPEPLRQVVFGMGCFWGAERLFWETPGVVTTAVGYAGGQLEHPGYREVCSGTTGHAEVVLVVYDPSKVSFETLLQVFWQGHDPTQGNRQGNDIGSQYRSVIFTSDDEQLRAARESAERFAPELAGAGYGPITTQIARAPVFYYAEDYHQQYLHKNPGGYCGLGGTGVACPSLAARAE